MADRPGSAAGRAIRLGRTDPDRPTEVAGLTVPVAGGVTTDAIDAEPGGALAAIGAGLPVVSIAHALPRPVAERACHAVVIHWCAWEDVHVSLQPGHQPSPRYLDPKFRMAFARLVTHYFRHAAWLEDGVLLREAGRLAGIPGVLVQGKFDVSGPPDIAWNLAQVWPDAEFILVDDAGHGASPDMTEVLIAATRRFAGER